MKQIKTPEQMAEEYRKVWGDEQLYKIRHEHKRFDWDDALIDGFLAGYQAAKDTYKDAISAYEEVAKQMLEEAVRIMSPKDQLANADKVMCNRTMEEIKAADTGELMPITNLPTSAKWISVKDRLPEINKGFIGFVENKEVCNCYRYPDSSSDGSPVFYAQSKLGLLIGGLESISHWQPLPKPPEDK